MEIKTSSPRETLKAAASFAKSLKAGDIVALYGDLGAGKTVFVKGLASGLGIKAKVTSPTFVFLKIYRGKNLTVYHIDLYRGESLRDFKDLGLDEMFSASSIAVIEWADRLEGKLPKKRIDVIITKIDDKIRSIKVDRRG